MTTVTITQRSSNLELFRIIAMLGIILSHYQVYLFDLMGTAPSSSLSIFHYILSTLGKIGINCFMLITGYFMCIKDISIRKYIKLLAQIYFYAIVINGVFVCTGDLQLDPKTLLLIVFPFRELSMDSFVTDFLWFYFFIPFIRTLVNSLSGIQHRRLLILSLLIFCVYTTIPGFKTELCPVTWFSVLMILSSYTRFYGIPYLENRKFECRTWFFVCIISFIALIVCIIIANRFGRINVPLTIASRPSFILMAMVSFSLFMLFEKMQISYNKNINLWGGASFGILLIHTCGEPMWRLIFDKLIDTREHFIAGHWWMPLISAAGIYVVCGMIEIFRQKTVEKPINDFLYKFFKV